MDNKQLYEKENNINKPFFPVVRLEDIIDTISEKSIQWILNNYNHIYVEWKNNVVGTRLSVPTILRRNGLWITYNNGDRLITEYYIGKNTEIKDKHWQDDVNWENYTNKLIDGTVEYRHLSENLKQLFTKGNITNFPDEEDLTSDGIALSFKDREYRPENFSGLGRVILRKNIIQVGEEYKNVLTQTMINKENTIYEIRYDFDLDGSKIAIPEGCVLDFQGGNFSNGMIVFNNTIINNTKVDSFISCHFDGVLLNNKINARHFGVKNDGVTDVTNVINELVNISSHLYIPDGVYLIYGTDEKDSYSWSINCGILLKDNFVLELANNCILKNIANANYHTYNIITIYNCNNVIIKGGIIDGSKFEYPSQSDFGYGIEIIRSNNIFIDKTIIKDCRADNINFQLHVENGTHYVNNNIQIRNCKLLNGGRNCCSLEAGTNIYFYNCEFTGAGGTYSNGNVTPGCGIDIEPYTIDYGTIVEKVTFDTCKLKDNQSNGISSVICTNRKIVIINSDIDAATFTSNLQFEGNYQNEIKIESSTIETILLYNVKDVSITNCNCGINISKLCENITICNNIINYILYHDYQISTDELYSEKCIISNNVIKGDAKFSLKDSIITNNIITSSIEAKYTYNCIISSNKIDSKSAQSILFSNVNNCRVQYNEFINPAYSNNYGDTIILFNCSYLTFENNTIRYENSNNKPSFYIRSYDSCSNITINEPNIIIGIHLYSGFNVGTLPNLKILPVNYGIGNFNNHPNYPPIGSSYFCTDRKTNEGDDNGIMIYHRGDNIWIDALGRIVK